MTTHVVFIEDDKGDVVDNVWYCSKSCCDIGNSDPTFEGGAWPCGSETSSDVYCATCNMLMWKGIDYE